MMGMIRIAMKHTYASKVQKQGKPNWIFCMLDYYLSLRKRLTSPKLRIFYY